MKISELEDKLENVNNKLMMVHETADAISMAVDQGGMKAENLTYAIGGISKSTYEATRDIESLVNEVIKIKAVLQEL